MAKRGRRKQTTLDKAAIGIGRALGKALNRIEGVDAEVRKVMEVRGRTLQEVGREAGRRIAYFGESSAKPKRRRAAKPAKQGAIASSKSRRRVTAPQKSRRVRKSD
jgi:hypothetical protein